MSNEDSHPGWYVAEWLAHLGVRQVDLVEETGWTKSQISEWVNGKQRFNETVLLTFARALGRQPAELLRPPPKTAQRRLSSYVEAMPDDKAERALQILRAAFGDRDDGGEVKRASTGKRT